MKPVSLPFRFAVFLTLLVCATPEIRAQSSGTLTTLHTFTASGSANPSNTDGAQPIAGLLEAVDGNLYGTTQLGGTNNYGAVFKITPAGTLTNFHSFAYGEGAYPRAELIEGFDANFYGTATAGGANGRGSVFKLARTTGTLTVLHSFSPVDGAFENAEGSSPKAALLQADDGNFYGTTFAGGANDTGTIFKMTPAGTVTVLHTFSTLVNQGNADGAFCAGPLVQGADGSFYGMASQGGLTASGQVGNGTIFKVTPSGGFTTLHKFSPLSQNKNTDGGHPEAGLVRGSDGNFYGTTQDGGAYSYGTIFKMTPAGVLTTLHSVNINAGEGDLPRAGLLLANDGNFYGSTSNGPGVLFRITPGGTFTVLHQFGFPNSSGLNTDGDQTAGTLIQARNYNFYGTNSVGGANGTGTVFRVSFTPKITGTLSATGAIGAAFSYQIAATNTPTGYGAAGLPSGLSINQKTGKITGTPTKTGTSSVTVAAFNNFGSGTGKLTLTVKAAAAKPVITSTLNPPSRQGVAFSYQITATNSPTSYGASGLPSGLAINQTTGKISGTPTKAGTYSVTIAAFNGGGSGSAKLTLVVKPPA